MDKKIKDLPKITRTLLRNLREATDCGIQHNGCPCNSCFHMYAEDELKLPPKLAHAFWLIVLSLRGDYEPEALEDAINNEFK